nr:A/G-specific adenine glycosylase [Lachnospiraceae bacterium]
GHLDASGALKAVEEQGFTPLRIESLPAAKHIFSHVEWHMTGYLIRIAETEKIPEGLLLADREETDRLYPVPAAYAAYRRFMR